MPNGAGPPPHVHERMSEGFYVLEGEIEYRVGDERHSQVARVASAVWIPPGTRHSFTVKSETARALNFYTPGGFDDLFRFLATPATERSLPPADLPDDLAPDAYNDYLKRLRDLHQETFVDPDEAVW